MQLNDDYKAKFAFPFILAVKGGAACALRRSQSAHATACRCYEEGYLGRLRQEVLLLLPERTQAGKRIAGGGGNGRGHGSGWAEPIRPTTGSRRLHEPEARQA